MNLLFIWTIDFYDNLVYVSHLSLNLNDLSGTTVKSELCKLAYIYTIVIRIIACRNGQVRPARDISGSVVRESDRVSTRKPSQPDRVSNYRDIAMRNISCMSVRQDDIDKAFVVTSGSSRRPRDILSLSPFLPLCSPSHIYLSTLRAPVRSPSDRCDSIFTSHNRRARAGPV